jgi:hypothetical protein
VVRRTTAALLGLALVASSAAAGAAELALALRSTTVEWGQPLRGHVTFTGDQDPGSIDLAVLDEGFHVERGFAEVSRTESGQTRRREAVSLYPRRLGEQSVRALAHGGARSLPVPIEVLPPQPEGAIVDVSVRVPDRRLKAGQQLVIRVDVATTDPRVRVETEPLRLPSAGTFLLPATETTDGPQIRRSLGWAVVLRSTGARSIDLPPLRYQLFGRDLRRFHFPSLRVEVEPIPAYVPITMPVGQVAVASTLAGERADRHWHLVVETDGQLPAGVPELQAELATLAGVDASRIAATQRTEARAEGVRTVVELRAPLPALLVGIGADLPVTLRYFDPVAGRLQVHTHRLPREWRLPPWLAAGLAAVGLGLLGIGARWAHSAHARWQTRRAYLHQIAQAGDPQSLRRLLLAAANHRTLGEWAAASGRPESARELAAALDAACFRSQPSVDLHALRDATLRVLRHRPRSSPRLARATSASSSSTL